MDERIRRWYGDATGPGTFLGGVGNVVSSAGDIAAGLRSVLNQLVAGEMLRHGIASHGAIDAYKGLQARYGADADAHLPDFYHAIAPGTSAAAERLPVVGGLAQFAEDNLTPVDIAMMATGARAAKAFPVASRVVGLMAGAPMVANGARTIYEAAAHPDPTMTATQRLNRAITGAGEAAMGLDALAHAAGGGPRAIPRAPSEGPPGLEAPGAPVTAAATRPSMEVAPRSVQQGDWAATEDGRHFFVARLTGPVAKVVDGLTGHVTKLPAAALSPVDFEPHGIAMTPQGPRLARIVGGTPTSKMLRVMYNDGTLDTLHRSVIQPLPEPSVAAGGSTQGAGSRGNRPPARTGGSFTAQASPDGEPPGRGARQSGAHATGSGSVGGGSGVDATAKELADAAQDLRASSATGTYHDVDGHHIMAKKAFQGAKGYDKDQALCVGKDFMRKRGWNHGAMTTAQQQMFTELGRRVRGAMRESTLSEHAEVAVKALMAGGATQAEALYLTACALDDLGAAGVTRPQGIPWVKR
jgi:hypothetical protein